MAYGHVVGGAQIQVLTLFRFPNLRLPQSAYASCEAISVPTVEGGGEDSDVRWAVAQRSPRK